MLLQNRDMTLKEKKVTPDVESVEEKSSMN
jgi:hypothetical protein